MKPRKLYVDGPFGQLHLRVWGDAGPLLLCLSPSPYSGVAYATLAPLLAKRFRVVAMDYPGYGLSDALPAAPTIDDYATAALTVADALSPDSPITLLGFHTGTLVAVQAAVMQPARVASCVLVDVPFFAPALRADLLEKMGRPRPLTPQLEMLADDWAFSVAKRLEHVPLARGYALFVDQISTGADGNAAFHAAFSYPCEERFARLTVPAFVVATRAGLFEHTVAAAAILPGAQLHDMDAVSVAVLEKGAPNVAHAVLAWLDTNGR